MDLTREQWRFSEGDQVFAADGQKLGRVAGAFPDFMQPVYLIVEKGLLFKHDYYVPREAINSVVGGEIYLNLTKDQALNAGWDTPPATTTMPGDARPSFEDTTPTG